MKLNDFFDEILVINLDKRQDRLDKVCRQFAKHDLSVSRAQAYDGRVMYPKLDPKTAGQLGCMKSHLECIRYAKSKNLRNILILEDDVEFHDNLEQRFTEAIEGLPPYWALLYLGGNNNNTPNSIIPYSVGLAKVNYLLCLHAYAVNANAYDTILNYADQARNPIIDVIMVELQPSIPSFKVDPNVAWQAAGYSDIEHRKVDYHFMRTK